MEAVKNSLKKFKSIQISASQASKTADEVLNAGRIFPKQLVYLQMKYSALKQIFRSSHVQGADIPLSVSSSPPLEVQIDGNDKVAIHFGPAMVRERLSGFIVYLIISQKRFL